MTGRVIVSGRSSYRRATRPSIHGAFEQGMFFSEHRHTGADAVNLRGCQRPFCKGWSDD
jgi:hypothetical protein